MSHVDKFEVISNPCDQSILITADVEDGQRIASTTFDAVGMGKRPPDIGQILPFGLERGSIPASKWFLGVRMPVPELPQRLEADDPHIDILSIWQEEVKSKIDNLSQSRAGSL